MDTHGPKGNSISHYPPLCFTQAIKRLFFPGKPIVWNRHVHGNIVALRFGKIDDTVTHLCTVIILTQWCNDCINSLELSLLLLSSIWNKWREAAPQTHWDYTIYEALLFTHTHNVGTAARTHIQTHQLAPVHGRQQIVPCHCLSHWWHWFNWVGRVPLIPGVITLAAQKRKKILPESIRSDWNSADVGLFVSLPSVPIVLVDRKLASSYLSDIKAAFSVCNIYFTAIKSPTVCNLQTV